MPIGSLVWFPKRLYPFWGKWDRPIWQMLDLWLTNAFSKKFENHKSTTGFQFKRQGRLPVRIGTIWDVSVPVRGRRRRFSAELSEYLPPRTLSYKSASPRYDGVMSITVESNSSSQCTLNIRIVAKSRSFATSLVFNTVRLARKRINRRANSEMDQFATRVTKAYLATLNA